VGQSVASQPNGKGTNQAAFLEIKEHTLRNVDHDPVADDIGYDVTVVDTQLLSCFQKRAWGNVIVCGENAHAYAEPCADACE